MDQKGPEGAENARATAAAGPIAVQVQGVNKVFGRGDAAVQALKGVDFEARQGELLMIVGPSGCGKTTLLSVIAGTLEFDAGNVTVFGSQLHGMTRAQVTAFRGRRIGFIFQSFNLVPTLNALENVSIPLLINGVARREAEARAQAMLERVGLGVPSRSMAASSNACPSPPATCASRPGARTRNNQFRY